MKLEAKSFLLLYIVKVQEKNRDSYSQFCST